MKYLILGASPNSMGLAIAARLLKEHGAVVMVADLNPQNEIFAHNFLQKFTKDKKSALDTPPWNGLDVNNPPQELKNIFADFDVVISALPAFLNWPIARAALEARKGYCDLGGVLEITKNLIAWEQDQKAKTLGCSLVPDCGLEPGLGNVIAVDMLKQFSRAEPVESLIIYVGGLPYVVPQNGESPYKQIFNLKGLEAIYYSRPLVLSHGKLRKILALSHYEELSARNFGLYYGEAKPIVYEAAVTGGLGVLPYYLQGQVLELEEKTLRYKGHYEFVKKTSRSKFISAIRQCVDKYKDWKDDISVMKVVATGKSAATGKRIKAERILLVRSDDDFTSMQKATGFPTAVMAKLIAEKKSLPGAMPPEIALDSALVLAELKNDFSIVETITPLK